ncbi:MAG: hypothetical protein HC933_05865 [Pleurocapsa sp. SU_196_0]|nr:hypothetical protein [Pleurocapsa sp. SU_196_0]
MPLGVGQAKILGMTLMFVLRAVVFVIASIIGCVLLPFLLVQYPLIGIVIIAAGIYWFSRSFAVRKKFQ